MSDRFFVDANILVHSHDRSAGEKHERALTLVQELWNNRSGVVAASTFSGANPTRRATTPA